MADSPLTKRPRIEANHSLENDDEIIILDPIAPSVFKKTKDWAADYQKATPYPHGIIPDLCNKGFLGE